ncbi:MAG: hypothetical protein LBP79_03460 [Clostridiales bacterium]|jgi:hypothetical protein|nr:hypothetical protein [Clostridiales bacterium]
MIYSVVKEKIARAAIFLRVCRMARIKSAEVRSGDHIAKCKANHKVHIVGMS